MYLRRRIWRAKMESNRIINVLAVILFTACMIVAATLVRVKYKIDYVPAEAIDDLVEILEDDGIYVDRSIISRKRTVGTVYMFDFDDYNHTVASLLGESVVRDSYAVPSGELVILENGDRFEFGEDFAFRYESENADTFSPNIVELQSYAVGCSAEEKESSVSAVRDFLNNGSSFFGDLDVGVMIDGIWEYDGVDYILCSRTIDDIMINGNLVLCTVENDKVTASYGTWCFFTPVTSYSAQLADILNILFNVKKELSSVTAEDGFEGIVIESVKSCYSLYFFGDGENFCLIPCWQITTDTHGELIYNAINGTLYTKTFE